MFQTVVVTQNQVICRLPEYFDEPNSFKPERWLRDNNNRINALREKSVNPYTVLPFGHGPRSCIARRFAEQNLQVVLLRVRVLKLIEELCTILNIIYNVMYNCIIDISMNSFSTDLQKPAVYMVRRISRLRFITNQ